MKISDYLAIKIDELPECDIFTADQFVNSEFGTGSLVRHLGLMVQSGKTARFSKGKFYKPRATVFGPLGPNEQEVMRDLLVKDGKQIGYPTGYQGIYSTPTMELSPALPIVCIYPLLKLRMTHVIMKNN